MWTLPVNSAYLLLNIPKRLLIILWLALYLIFLSGCNSEIGPVKTAPVSGKVTLDGEPLPWGVITFTPSEGRSATGIIQDGGFYRLSTYGENDGAAIGRHGVSIVCTDQKPGVELDPLIEGPPPKWLIPRSYAEPSLSGLSFVVAPDVENTADFDLKQE